MSAQPWSVKGIDPKVREAARDAARRQGITLGEYFNRLLTAQEDPRRTAHELRARRAPQEFSEDEDDGDWIVAPPAPPRFGEGATRVTQRLEASERRTQLALAGLDRTVTAMDRTMLGLAQRVEDAEYGALESADRVTDALTQFRATHEDLAAKLKDAEEEAARSRRALDDSSASLNDVRDGMERRIASAEGAIKAAEAAAALLAERIAGRDEKLAQALLEVERRLRGDVEAALAEARGAAEEANHADAAGARALEQERMQQDVLAQRIATTEHAARQTAHDAVSQTHAVRAELAARLDALEESAAREAERAPVLAELHAAQEILDARIVECESGLRTASSGAIEEMRRIQATLSERIERIESSTGPSAEHVRGLTQKLDQVEQTARDSYASLRQGAGAAVADLRNAQLSLAARVKQVEEKAAAPSPELHGKMERLAAVADAQGEQLNRALAAFSQRLAAGDAKAVEVDGAVRTIESSVQKMAERLAQTEQAANSAIQKLDEVSASVQSNAAAAADGVRALLERRLDAMTAQLSAMIETTRGELGARFDQIDAGALASSIGEVQRRLDSAERRQAQTIEAISIEMKRMSETIDRRLRTLEGKDDEAVMGALREEMERMAGALETRFEEIERREVAVMDRVGGEIAKLSERIEERTNSVESRSAHAIEQIGEQVARVAERFNRRQEESTADLTQRLDQSEQRVSARLTDKLAEIERRLELTEAVGVSPRPVAPPASRDHYAAFEAARPGAHKPAPTHPVDPNYAIDVIDDPDSVDFGALEETPFAPAEPGGLVTYQSEDFYVDDAPPPPPTDDGEWSVEGEPAAPAGVSLFGEASQTPQPAPQPAPLPLLAPEAEPAKDDYLATARRAARAAARQSGPSAAKPAGKRAAPVVGLRGPGRVIRWGTVGVLATAAAIGGVMYLREQPDQAGDDRQSAEGPALGPRAAEAAPSEPEGPAAAHLSDVPLEDAAPPAPTDVPLGDGQPAGVPLANSLPGARPGAVVAGPLPQRAISLDQAVARGDALAQYDLALQRIAAGRTPEAVTLLRAAAEQGFAMAQYRLAKLYERGEGVRADLAQARQWTERAAVAGNRRAMHDLGVFYARGEGAGVNEQAAFRWFRQAAELGVTDSQYNLGVLYQQGRGVAASAPDAMFWFLVAARNGDADARTRAETLAATLAAAQATQARTRAAAFRPRAASAQANGEFGPRPWAQAQQTQPAQAARPRG